MSLNMSMQELKAQLQANMAKVTSDLATVAIPTDAATSPRTSPTQELRGEGARMEVEVPPAAPVSKAVEPEDPTSCLWHLARRHTDVKGAGPTYSLSRGLFAKYMYPDGRTYDRNMADPETSLEEKFKFLAATVATGLQLPLMENFRLPRTTPEHPEVTRHLGGYVRDVSEMMYRLGIDPHQKPKCLEVALNFIAAAYREMCIRLKSVTEAQNRAGAAGGRSPAKTLNEDALDFIRGRTPDLCQLYDIMYALSQIPDITKAHWQEVQDRLCIMASQRLMRSIAKNDLYFGPMSKGEENTTIVGPVLCSDIFPISVQKPPLPSGEWSGLEVVQIANMWIPDNPNRCYYLVHPGMYGSFSPSIEVHNAVVAQNGGHMPPFPSVRPTMPPWMVQEKNQRITPLPLPPS